MALINTVTISGVNIPNAYIRIYCVNRHNGDGVDIDYGIYGSEQLCDHGKGAKIGNYVRVQLVSPLSLSYMVIPEATEENPEPQPITTYYTDYVQAAYAYLKTLPEFQGAVDA
jgi:hypothetical protein